MSASGSTPAVLGDKYEHAPVPAHARRSIFSVSMVWPGFPMIITGAMTGSVMVADLFFVRRGAAIGTDWRGRAFIAAGLCYFLIHQRRAATVAPAQG